VSSSPSGLGRNTALNTVGFVIPTMVSLLAVPLYLDSIGQTRYGALAIFWVLLGYFSFDLGLGRATTNEIAKLRGADHAAARSSVVWTAIATMAALGAAGAVVLYTVGFTLVEGVVGLPPTLEGEATSALPWMAAAVPFVTLSFVLVGTLEGLERFGAVNAIEVAGALVFQVAPLAVAYLHGPDLGWLVAAAALGPVSKTLLAAAVCWRHVPIGRPEVCRRRAKALVRYGGWITVTAVIGPVLTTMDRVLLGAIAGAQAVTRYVIPMNLVSRLAVIPFGLARSLFPRLSAVDDGRARDLGRDSILVLAAVFTPLIVIASVAMEPFLRIWLGPSLASASTPIAIILLGGVWVNSLALIPFTLLQGRGRPDLTAKLHLIEVGPYLLVLFVGVELGGAAGLAVAWSLRVTADAALLLTLSGIGWRSLARMVPTILVVGTSLVAALVAYDEPIARVIGGSLLVLLSVAAAGMSVPRHLFPRTRWVVPAWARSTVPRGEVG
jgi:O-antigen/teichoic acid export membrane protein